jgi:hypothetical protein
MANCPNCGSSDIQLKQDSNINWGRAIAGWALFGVVGGAVGAVTGESRTANACLDCGTAWRAEDLYKILQYIESITRIRLDMSIESDRRKVNFFVTNVQPTAEKLELANKTLEGYTNINDGKATWQSFAGWLVFWLASAGLTIWAFSLAFTGQAIGGTLGIFIILGSWTIANSSGQLKDKKRAARKEKIEYQKAFDLKIADFKDIFF